ncbi:hypothetical protein WKT20_01215 [Phocaeicola sp. ICN-14070]|uniref:hypothetical protein n=1 Tax=Phocaeicola sp. ICN-14070 TaxID=3134656 RepID=UPI0030C29BB5
MINLISKYSVLFLLLSSFVSSCTKEEVLEVKEVTGPYKTTQLSIEMKVEDSANPNFKPVNMLFSALMKASVHWGDGVVEDANGELQHKYKEDGEYILEVKGEEKCPSFYISNVNYVEVINWPVADETPVNESATTIEE